MTVKYYEFNDDQNKIEFYNSIFGIEKVLINGKLLSNKFSMTGRKHQFRIDSDIFILKSNIKLFGDRVINFDLSKNEKLIDSKIARFDKKQRLIWIILGFPIGFGLYKLINFLILALRTY